MTEILELLGFEFLCKSHIFNFKSGATQPKTGVQYFGNFEKNVKNTKIEQNFKNVKSDLRSFLHRYKLITSEI
jgi:hypothetical protein